MKKQLISLSAIILGVVFSTLFTHCESKQHVQSDIEKLKSERTALQQQTANLSSAINQQHIELAEASVNLQHKLKELGIYNAGKTPKYILKIHLKQSHVSLSISKHIKDAMNAIDFEMPVDKDFYNSVSVGTKIVNEFRAGSFILYGSFGDWNMTVKNKEIR